MEKTAVKTKNRRLPRIAAAAPAEALPDTRRFLPSRDAGDSIGGGWRTAPACFEMRKLFGMVCQPGETGTGKDS